MERLADKLRKLDINVNDDMLDKFNVYYQMLIETNKVMNLTAITNKDEVIDKHFVDSVALGKVYDLKKDLCVIDVGTGAGFPGIPLKIVYPNLSIVLLDSLNKRVNFLNSVIEELELNDIVAVHNRAEDGARDLRYREQFDLCVSRAVANLSTLSEYCIPYVKKDGYFISYKSANVNEEVEFSKKAMGMLGAKYEKTENVLLPDTDLNRSFVFIHKHSNTSKAFPRKAGTASKNPLK